MAKVDSRLAERPEDGGLWYQRAVLEFEHEEFLAAAEDFAKAEKFAPGENAVLWWQGRILDNLGKPLEAKVTFDTFLAQFPNHWGALASRARVQMTLGSAEAALSDFRASLANCPDAQPDLIQEVAQAFASRNQVDEAIRVLETGLKRLGAIPSLQIKLLDVESDANRFNPALARLDVIQKASARPEPWMSKRAQILTQAGRLSEARAAWQAMISHIHTLPAAERESHAISLHEEQARRGLQALSAVSTASATSNPFTRLNP